MIENNKKKEKWFRKKWWGGGVSEIGGWCNNTIERDIQISINHAAGENKLNLFCFTNIGTPNLKFFDWMEGGGPSE
jgi:hypothetical protein